MEENFTLNNMNRKYQQVISAFLKREVPLSLVDEYLKKSDEGYFKIIDFIGMNLKEEFHWTTNLAVLEAAEHMYEEGKDNGNF